MEHARKSARDYFLAKFLRKNLRQKTKENMGGYNKNRYPMGTCVYYYYKAGWMLVDGSRNRQPELVAFVGQLSGSCTAANVSSWIPSSSRTNLRCFWLVPNINARPFIDSYSHYVYITYRRLTGYSSHVGWLKFSSIHQIQLTVETTFCTSLD